VLDAVAYRKSQGKIPADAEMLPIPKKAGDPGIVTAEDVQAMVKAEGLGEIAAGDCVALHTGQGNSWSNDRYKTMTSEQRKAARDLFAQGEPGFGVSACEYFGTRDIALTIGDTSANDAQPGGEAEDYAVPCHTKARPGAVSGILRTSTPSRSSTPRSRKRLHLGTAADDRRDRLAGQSDRAVLSLLADARKSRRCPEAGAAVTMQRHFLDRRA